MPGLAADRARKTITTRSVCSQRSFRRGRDAAKDLRRLLDLKDAAQYGVIHVSAAELRSALRRARALVLFAADTTASDGT